MKNVVIVIPFYRSTLSAYERIALQQCGRILSSRPVVVIKPARLTLPDEAAGLVSFTSVESFDDSYFESVTGYNRLMLSAEFYHRFAAYEYLLIYQLDAFVFSDELDYWCSRNLDYIGAPWIKPEPEKNILLEFKQWYKAYEYTHLQKVHLKRLPRDRQFFNRVGNGGLSLRRVKKFSDIIAGRPSQINTYLTAGIGNYHEDFFWSVEVNRQRRELRIPGWKTGLAFAFEMYPDRAYQINRQQLPFGCHAWEKNTGFWRPFFERFGYAI